MIDLKGFRKQNKLSQKDLAEALGVSRSFIGQVEAGFSKLPDDKLDKLLANTNGWDVSMLIVEGDLIAQRGGSNNVGKVEGEQSALKKEIEMLREQVEELRAEKARYWDMIERLTKTR